MNGLIRTLLPVCLIVALALGTSPADAQTKDPAVIANVRLVSDTGQTVKLGDLRGKVVFINFWGAWCAPCGQEMPSIRNLQAALADRRNDVEFVFISALHDWFARDSEHFKELGMSGHNYDWPKRPPQQWEFFMGPGAGAFHFRSPTTYVLDRAGNVAMERSGAVEWSVHTNEIRALLARN
jgi:peroxiredoxin